MKLATLSTTLLYCLAAICEEKAAGRQPRIWIDSCEFQSEINAVTPTEKGHLRMRRKVKKKTPIRINNGPSPLKLRLQQQPQPMEEVSVIADVSEESDVREEQPAPVAPPRQIRMAQREVSEQSDGIFIPPPYYIPQRAVGVDEEIDEDDDETVAEIFNQKRPNHIDPERKPIYIARSPHMNS